MGLYSLSDQAISGKCDSQIIKRTSIGTLTSSIVTSFSKILLLLMDPLLNACTHTFGVIASFSLRALDGPLQTRPAAVNPLQGFRKTAISP